MRAVSFASLLVPLLGCADQSTVCTAEFAMVPLTVLTQGGAPVSGLTISATTLRTGQSYGISQQNGIGGPGAYIVFDDGLRDRIRSSGDPVRVTGSDAAPRFTADFVFDIRGGCHVRKVAGPDTVRVP